MTRVSDTALVSGGDEKRKLPLRIFAPLWRFFTVELFLYFTCHVVCLGVAFFAAGDVSLSQLTREFMQKLWGHSQRKELQRNPFEVFRDYKKAASLPPASPSHGVSSDILLTLLLLFSLNAFFLALIRRVEYVVAGERKKKQDDEMEGTSKVTSHINEREISDGATSLWMVDCDQLMKNTMVLFASVLCVVIPICVFSQPSNEVRSIGPAAVLMSIAIGLCVLEVHGGMRSLQAFLNGFQALVVVTLVFLVTVEKLSPNA
ncbi:hypothetical protein BCY84_20018 [Trypanosoma cruzi cruzi]|uniref:Uncharacterized protein n=1 Tax=Trypanosoma cruzi TaxID=5693 RepID=A0A2V2V7A6_TRYCR|nr:hypothetical protein BCY84_20018 [Trypanosoma cruzi cruzi]PWU92387.1 hypothetical protein C4B63_38g146 [Trypanosoma cruzi]